MANAVAVGNVHFTATRLIPQSMFTSSNGRRDLMDFFDYLVSSGGDPYIPVVPPVLYNETTPKDTSATPAWRKSIWSFGVGTAFAWNSTLSERQSKIAHANKMTAMLEEITPGSGAYTNEASLFTEDWQEARRTTRSFWPSSTSMTRMG